MNAWHFGVSEKREHKPQSHISTWANWMRLAPLACGCVLLALPFILFIFFDNAIHAVVACFVDQLVATVPTTHRIGDTVDKQPLWTHFRFKFHYIFLPSLSPSRSRLLQFSSGESAPIQLFLKSWENEVPVCIFSIFYSWSGCAWLCDTKCDVLFSRWLNVLHSLRGATERQPREKEKRVYAHSVTLFRSHLFPSNKNVCVCALRLESRCAVLTHHSLRHTRVHSRL